MRIVLRPGSVATMTGSAREPTCVRLDTDHPEIFIKTICTALRAEWAGEYRKVFVTANRDIVQAMVAKGQARMLPGGHFVREAEKILDQAEKAAGSSKAAPSIIPEIA